LLDHHLTTDNSSPKASSKMATAQTSTISIDGSPTHNSGYHSPPSAFHPPLPQQTKKPQQADKHLSPLNDTFPASELCACDLQSLILSFAN
jgi:hypothetical protein